MRYGNVELHNVVELLPADGGAGQWLLRIPQAVREPLNEYARLNAPVPAGCEIRFNVAPGGTGKVVLACDMDNIIPPMAEVFQGCFRDRVVVIEKSATTIEVGVHYNAELLEKASREGKLPFDPKLTRILLPALHRVQLLEVSGDITPPRPEQVPQRRYLAYGSSITHGATSVRPSGTWAAQAAKWLQADLVDLGFGGGAHMEETIARHIAGRDDWNFATLEMGINCGGWPPEKLAAAVERFLDVILERHADKWIFCVDMFTYFGDLGADTAGPEAFRRVVREAVANRNLPRLVHLDGRELLRETSGLTCDLVHPSDDGMWEIGWRIADVMGQAMGW